MTKLRVGVGALSVLFPCAAWALDGSTPLEITPTNIPGTDWRILELYTNGNNISAIADPGYTQRTNFDGIGAYAHDANTVRVFMNHEANPASVSYLDLNRTNLRNWLASASPTAPAQVVSHIGQAYTSIVGDTTLTSFCSSSMLEPNHFGASRGLASRIYMTGEEVSGGRLYAIDAEPSSGTYRTMYETGLPSGSWENAIEFDTGRTDRVGMMLFEDAGSDTTNGTAPLRIWIGNKNPGGDFLDRNGLRTGTTYNWIPSSGGTSAPAAFTSTGTTLSGTWSTSSTGAMKFSKLEDGHLSPASGTTTAFNCQDQGTFTVNLSLAFDAGGTLTAGSGATIKMLLEEANDGGAAAGYNNLDNMVWSTASLMFTQEDGSNQQIWQLDPTSAAADRAALAIAQVTGGAGESSGIVDVSELVGYVPGSVLLTVSQDGAANAANNQLVLMFSPNAALVPEPASLALLTPLLCVRRRIRRPASLAS